MTYSHPLCSMSMEPAILWYSYFKIWPWKSMVKVMCGQSSRSHLTLKIQRSRSWSRLRPGVQSIYLLFVTWQSDHFWLRYSKFHIWHWKFKVKVMAKVKPDAYIWGLEFNRYVCFSFRSNRTIFGWDIANSIFDLENSRWRSWPRSDLNLMVTFEALVSIDMFAFHFMVITNQTIFGWDIANSMFDLENSRSRSWPRSNPMVTFEA